MSKLSIPDTIEQVQKALKRINPEISVDRNPGPQTWVAIYNYIVLGKHGSSSDVIIPSAPIMEIDTEAIHPRSETNIAALHPRVRPLARSLMLRAAEHGWDFRITSGLRTYAEQNALYAKGRTTKGPRVTNARAGYSNHNFGLAFDVTLFSGGRPVWDSPLYKALATIGMGLGLEWGGSWTSINDQPHYQLRPSWAKNLSETAMITELRRRTAAGEDLLA